MYTDKHLAALHSDELRKLVNLAADASAAARYFNGPLAQKYCALAASCAFELWSRRQRAVGRCGRVSVPEAIPAI